MYINDVGKEGAGNNRQRKYIWSIFLKTAIEEPNEELVWTVYNCIREIENSIRTLKTDLDCVPSFIKPMMHRRRTFILD